MYVTDQPGKNESAVVVGCHSFALPRCLMERFTHMDDHARGAIGRDM
jgi:hypothetical protein